MRNDKDKVTALRKEGWSYRKLMTELGVPRATLSDWFGKKQWSKEIKNNLNSKNLELSRERMVHLGKIRGTNLARVYETAREEARKDFDVLKHDPLFVAGIITYWGEGDKVSNNGFRVTNSDPLLLKIFLNFLRKVTGDDENRIRAFVLAYPDLDKTECEKYWSHVLGLSINNFTKTIIIQGRHKTKRVSYGICTINYSSRFLKQKMLIWMSLLAEELTKR